MEISETGFEGLLIIEPKVFGDERGYFFESYNKEGWTKLGLNFEFVQDNEAKSTKNVFRGFHYQIPPFAQSKLVRVIQGSVIDMVVDIRPGSETYGKCYQIELSAQNKRQFLVPRGFAHGYISLEEDTIFSYKVDNYYSRDHEFGISHLDDQLAFEWPLNKKDLLISEKDKRNPNLGEHRAYE